MSAFARRRGRGHLPSQPRFQSGDIHSTTARFGTVCICGSDCPSLPRSRKDRRHRAITRTPRFGRERAAAPHVHFRFSHRKASRPVVAVAGEKPHAPGIPAHQQSEAVVLDLMEPPVTSGRFSAGLGRQGSQRSGKATRRNNMAGINEPARAGESSRMLFAAGAALLWLGHFVATCATGKRLICKVPLSARPIMARAPTSMQIVITRLLRSLIRGNA
jgi:hypothetical protein